MAGEVSSVALAFQDSLPATPCEPLPTAVFPLDERADELAPGHEEGHNEVLAAFAEQNGLVKSVKNEGWVPLIRQLQGPRLRTSLSLPPPGGRGMWFFGKYSRVGLMWDRRKLDLSDAFIWPSGYFAKSEFNVDKDGSLLNGRGDALVTLEELILANQTLTFECMGRGVVTGETMPFNEILGYVDGTQGLVGMFARSTKVVHLLFAMGIRALLYRTLPNVGVLPIFVHDPDLGFRPFSRKAQSALVSEYFLRPSSGVRSTMAGSGLPCLPLDTQLLELGELEQLVFHGSFAITEEALASLVNVLLSEDRKEDDAIVTDGTTHRAKPCPFQTRAFLALGLRAAVEADNPSSAMSLVRHVAPFLVTEKISCVRGPLALSLQRRNSEMIEVSLDGEDFATYLHRLVGQARSSSVLVPVGAAIVIEEFASGQMMPRILAACQRLEAWLQDSRSVIFRLRSFRELHSHHVPGSGPDIKSFVSHKAITNRKEFHNALLELRRYQESHDVLHGMSKLCALVSGLHHPCMRLELLQHILGLDDRYDLQTVVGVASLALQIVSDKLHFGGPAPAKLEALSPRNDEATETFQLEAAATRMQGLDREDKPLGELLAGSA